MVQILFKISDVLDPNNAVIDTIFRVWFRTNKICCICALFPSRSSSPSLDVCMEFSEFVFPVTPYEVRVRIQKKLGNNNDNGRNFHIFRGILALLKWFVTQDCSKLALMLICTRREFMVPLAVPVPQFENRCRMSISQRWQFRFVQTNAYTRRLRCFETSLIKQL